MPITETKLAHRPNTSVSFWKDTAPAELAATRAKIQSLIDNGNVSYTTTLNDDQLIQTTVATFDTIETYNAVETAAGIELDNAYITYTKNNNMFYLAPQNPTTSRPMVYTQTGFDQPFTCTTVYTLPEADSFIEAIGTVIQNSDSYGKLTSVTIAETSLTLVHTYNNSADFTEFYYDDLSAIPLGWAQKNATRTITYALV
jgi:enamine deaminase RidA (YjgF/YER057c/UK114 family)